MATLRNNFRLSSAARYVALVGQIVLGVCLGYGQTTNTTNSCLDCHSALPDPLEVTQDKFSQDIHAQKGLTHWFDASVEQKVLRKARIMSLFLRDGAKGFVNARTGALALNKVLIPIDDHPNSLPALGRIEAIVKLIFPTANIQLLHVGDCAPTLIDEQGKSPDLPVMIRKGATVETILRVAEDLGVDLIAMPTAGRHSLLDAVRGSTTARVLDDARWPLLTVPVG